MALVQVLPLELGGTDNQLFHVLNFDTLSFRELLREFLYLGQLLCRWLLYLLLFPHFLNLALIRLNCLVVSFLNYIQRLKDRHCH